MTRTKLKTEVDKLQSSLMKDINRLTKLCNKYNRNTIKRKTQIRMYNKLIDKLLDEKRITKEELKEFIKKNL